MKKKQYMSPLVEVVSLDTELMQHLNSPSTTEFPGGPAGLAPRKHWTDVF